MTKLRTALAAKVQGILEECLKTKDNKIVGTGPASFRIVDALSVPVMSALMSIIELKDIVGSQTTFEFVEDQLARWNRRGFDLHYDEEKDQCRH